MRDETKKVRLCKECEYCYDEDHYSGIGLCKKLAGPLENQNVVGINAAACDLFKPRNKEKK